MGEHGGCAFGSSGVNTRSIIVYWKKLGGKPEKLEIYGSFAGFGGISARFAGIRCRLDHMMCKQSSIYCGAKMPKGVWGVIARSWHLANLRRHRKEPSAGFWQGWCGCCMVVLWELPKTCTFSTYIHWIGGFPSPFTPNAWGWGENMGPEPPKAPRRRRHVCPYGWTT